jgi:hypothetical protein
MADDDLAQRVDDWLVPLATIPPARRERGRPIARRDRIVGFVLVAIVVFVITGATWAILNATSSPRRSPVSPGQPLSCLGLVGHGATKAERVLEARGLDVSWRLVLYQAPNGKLSTTTAISTPPAHSIVEDVVQAAPDRVYVFVHHAADRYAPTPTASGCAKQ